MLRCLPLDILRITLPPPLLLLLLLLLVCTLRRRFAATTTATVTAAAGQFAFARRRPTRLQQERVDCDASWSTVPSAPGQLTVRIAQLARCVFVFVPADIFFRVEHCQPEALHPVPGLGVDVGHLTEEEFVQEDFVEGTRVLVDSVSVDCKDCARLKADTVWKTAVAEKVLKILARSLGGFLARHHRPFLPAWIFLPRYTVPMIEELQLAASKCCDLAALGGRSLVSHLRWAYEDMIVNTTLNEDSDIRKSVVGAHNVMKVGMAFAANIGEVTCSSGELGGADIALAVYERRLSYRGKPGEILVVLGNDKLDDGWTVHECGRGEKRLLNDRFP